MPESPRTVLMVDDDADDRMLAGLAIAECGAEAELSFVLDGIELMDYLSERSRSEKKGLPDLILLDLNMPRKDGREALAEIKSHPAFRHIPIVILTTSEHQKDVALAREAGAESFITKPTTFDEWVQIMKSLAERWLR